jgi:hypothetical protein
VFSHTIGDGGDTNGCVENETVAGTFSQIGEAWSFGEVDGIARLGDSEGTTTQQPQQQREDDLCRL